MTEFLKSDAFVAVRSMIKDSDRLKIFDNSLALEELAANPPTKEPGIRFVGAFFQREEIALRYALKESLPNHLEMAKEIVESFKSRKLSDAREQSLDVNRGITP